MSVTILSIGYAEFAIRKPADAATIIRLMAEAVPVESAFHNNKSVYFPQPHGRNREIGMKVIPNDSLVASDPHLEGPPADDVCVPRRRGLKLTGPSIKTEPPSAE